MRMKTLREIHDEAMDALKKTLGPVDMIRFLQIYEAGSGDWTQEQKKILEKDPDKIIKSIMARRKKAPAP